MVITFLRSLSSFGSRFSVSVRLLSICAAFINFILPSFYPVLLHSLPSFILSSFSLSCFIFSVLPLFTFSSATFLSALPSLYPPLLISLCTIFFSSVVPFSIVLLLYFCLRFHLSTSFLIYLCTAFFFSALHIPVSPLPSFCLRFHLLFVFLFMNVLHSSYVHCLFCLSSVFFLLRFNLSICHFLFLCVLPSLSLPCLLSVECFYLSARRLLFLSALTSFFLSRVVSFVSSVPSFSLRFHLSACVFLFLPVLSFFSQSC